MATSSYTVPSFSSPGRTSSVHWFIALIIVILLVYIVVISRETDPGNLEYLYGSLLNCAILLTIIAVLMS